jgi:hypothetical protein
VPKVTPKLAKRIHDFFHPDEPVGELSASQDSLTGEAL